jgi:hypothetical protein
MPQIDFADIFNQLKSDTANFAQTSLKSYVDDAKSDCQNFLESVKDKLEKWTGLLANGSLAKEDFEWLVYSQKELAEMNALKQAGLAEISIDQFRGGLINLIIDSIFHALKL